MEIERKFTITGLPDDLEQHTCLIIEQAYLNTDPVLRIRRQNDDYYLTYKGKGLLSREEYNLPLNEAAYRHLKEKADGNVISKTRYLIPIENPVFSGDFTPPAKLPPLTIQPDVFDPPFAPLVIAEVEFPDEQTAHAFLPPGFLIEDVTNDPAYHNSTLSQKAFK